MCRLLKFGVMNILERLRIFFLKLFGSCGRCFVMMLFERMSIFCVVFFCVGLSSVVLMIVIVFFFCV